MTRQADARPDPMAVARRYHDLFLENVARFAEAPPGKLGRGQDATPAPADAGNHEGGQGEVPDE